MDMKWKPLKINKANNMYVPQSLKAKLAGNPSEVPEEVEVGYLQAFTTIVLFPKETSEENLFTELKMLKNLVFKMSKKAGWNLVKSMIIKSWGSTEQEIEIRIDPRIKAWLDEIVAKRTMFSIDDTINAIFFVFKILDLDTDEEKPLFNPTDYPSLPKMIERIRTGKVSQYWENILKGIEIRKIRNQKRIIGGISKRFTFPLLKFKLNSNIFDTKNIPKDQDISEFFNQWILCAWKAADDDNFNGRFIQEKLGMTLPLTPLEIFKNLDERMSNLNLFTKPYKYGEKPETVFDNPQEEKA